jgi:hypothetical protein
MRFYQFWEEVTSPQFSNAILHTIAQSVFGDCEGMGYINCRFQNRLLEFYYSSQTNSVEISFYWRASPKEVSNKNSEFTTGTQLQPGTVEAMHKLIEFARKLKEYKVNIKFFTEGRRAIIYDKALAIAGYKKTSTPNQTYSYYAPA